MKRLGLVLGVLVLALAGAVVVREAVADDRPPLVVVHWSNSHPMREGLLPAMAEEFNDANHETASGQDIEIVVAKCDSSAQADDLVARVGGGRAEVGCGDDPTIVTPQSSDWLVDVNDRAGRQVVDLATTDNIAETWLGIVTYEGMARCLGWPDTPIGYEDIIALADAPDGWESQGSCAKPGWGREPLLAFTNPDTSTSGRNVLVTLYSIAAGKAPGDLTTADIERPEVVDYVKGFQDLVDHYMPGTIALNTKIVQGPRYGHFFLMPEDNLVSLYNGSEKHIAADGTEQAVPAVQDLVMIYPKEGSVLNANPAAIVDAPWVNDEQVEAAHDWIDFLRADEQQEKFMAAGFRPATAELAVDEGQFADWGLDASEPQTVIEPGDLDPDVLAGIMGSWGEVKNPAIVTFVVDVSGSMEGEKLEQVQAGLTKMLDSMSAAGSGGVDNQVGLLTFSDEVNAEIPPAPLADSSYDIAAEVFEMEAGGATALYDAVARAVWITGAVPGDDRARRSVVVLSDGEATAGGCLDDLLTMTSRDEVSVSDFCGLNGEDPVDDHGNAITRQDLQGVSLYIQTIHDVQVFFLGFGDADIQIGRILAQATGAEYQGSTNEDLATVIEELSGYF